MIHTLRESCNSPSGFFARVCTSYKSTVRLRMLLELDKASSQPEGNTSTDYNKISMIHSVSILFICLEGLLQLNGNLFLFPLQSHPQHLLMQNAFSETILSGMSIRRLWYVLTKKTNQVILEWHFPIYVFLEKGEKLRTP